AGTAPPRAWIGDSSRASRRRARRHLRRRPTLRRGRSAGDQRTLWHPHHAHRRTRIGRVRSVNSLSWFGIAGSLAMVLGVLVLTLRLLKRFAPRVANGRAVTLMVTQRVPVGPRQSIAIVQIGERLVAVSTGEGGVRLISEIGTAESGTAESGTAGSGT